MDKNRSITLTSEDREEIEEAIGSVLMGKPGIFSPALSAKITTALSQMPRMPEGEGKALLEKYFPDLEERIEEFNKELERQGFFPTKSH
jgi:hypothetical protein